MFMNYNIDKFVKEHKMNVLFKDMSAYYYSDPTVRKYIDITNAYNSVNLDVINDLFKEHKLPIAINKYFKFNEKYYKREQGIYITQGSAVGRVIWDAFLTMLLKDFKGKVMWF